jgi:hypothetical protein
MITPVEAKAARVLLGWTEHDVAAKVSGRDCDIKDFEQGRPTPTNLPVVGLFKLFRSAGVEFRDNGAPLLKRPHVSFRARTSTFNRC